MIFPKALVALVAANLAQATYTIKFISIDSQDRFISWTANSLPNQPGVLYTAPAGQVLPGLGTFTTTIELDPRDNNWGGHAIATNGSSPPTDPYPYAWAEFNFQGGTGTTWFDMSWNPCFLAKAGADAHGMKMIIADDEPTKNTGCLTWDDAGCLPPQAYWTDPNMDGNPNNSGTKSSTSKEYTVLVGGFGPTGQKNIQFNSYMSGGTGGNTPAASGVASSAAVPAPTATHGGWGRRRARRAPRV